MMIAYAAGILTGYALAHPAVRAWITDKFYQLLAAIRAKMVKK